MAKKTSQARTYRVGIAELRRLAEEAVAASGLDTQQRLAQATGIHQPALSKALNPDHGTRYKGVLVTLVNQFHPSKHIENEELMFTVARKTKGA